MKGLGSKGNRDVVSAGSETQTFGVKKVDNGQISFYGGHLTLVILFHTKFLQSTLCLVKDFDLKVAKYFCAWSCNRKVDCQ